MSSADHKHNILTELIQFALVDGHLDESELEFLIHLASDLEVSRESFLDLFSNPLPSKPLPNVHDRIIQFYRLCLLMHADGLVHPKESVRLHEMGIKMGLDPMGLEKILDMLDEAAGETIDANVLFELFSVQWN